MVRDQYKKRVLKRLAEEVPRVVLSSHKPLQVRVMNNTFLQIAIE